MSKNATRNRRNRKEVISDAPKERLNQIIREEEDYGRKQAAPKIEAKNPRQKEALAYLREGRRVVFLTGSAGTGKSMLATWKAATELKLKHIDKVYLVRPAVSVGKSVGMLPGDIKEKLAPYFMQTMKHLRSFLGNGFMDYCIEKEIIQMLPVEYLRGMSFEDCIVIAEEVQNFDEEEMEMMLTRLGQNCSILFTGDTKQHDLRGESGLDQTLKLLNHVMTSHPHYLDADDIEQLDSGIGVVRFAPEDVVRDGLTKAFVKVYYNA